MAIYKLGEISVIKNGKTPSTKDFSLWKKEIPFFGPSDIESQIPTRFITRINDWKRAGTTVISTTATIGNIGFLKTEAWFNQQMTSIEPNNDFVLDKYIFYYFLKNKNVIKNMSGGGSVFKILPISTFKNWVINIPLTTEQQKIIDFIEPIEKMIDKSNMIIQTVMNLIKILGTKIVYSSADLENINIQIQKEFKYNRGFYCQTADVGDFNNKIKKIEFRSPLPSRGRLIREPETLYISKLIGEKKILFRNWSPNIILSNGFWGLKSESKFKYSNFSFFFTDIFYKKKMDYSTGTTMVGLNNESLKSILSETFIENNLIIEKGLKNLFDLLSLISNTLEKLELKKDHLIKMLIK